MAHDLTTPLGRSIAYLDMYLRDHQILRSIYCNRHAIGGGMYRSGQPSPWQLRDWHRKFGLRTVINLRGDHGYGSYALEAEACQRLGITLVNHRLMSRQLPTVDEVLATRELFERVEYPVLMHCKSGADRAGLASTLYRHFRFGEPISSLRQLHWRFGHFRAGHTANLDLFFEAYQRDDARSPIAFIDWLRTRYDRAALEAEFYRLVSSPLGTWWVDRVLHRE